MKEVTVFQSHQPYALALSFTLDGKFLISAGMDNLIKLWAVEDWLLIGVFEGHTKSVNVIDLSPDGGNLASGSSDQTVRLWSFPAGDLLQTFHERKQSVGALTFSPDGRWIASGWYGGWLSVRTIEGQPIAGFKASQRHITSLAFSPQANLLASAGIGNDIKLWQLPCGEAIATLSHHQGAVGSLKFIEAGNRLVSFGYEKRAVFWDLPSMKPERVFEVTGSDPRGLVVSPDESIAAIPMRSQVELRAIHDWSLVERLPVGSKVVNSLAFAPDGKTLVASGGDGKLRVFAA